MEHDILKESVEPNQITYNAALRTLPAASWLSAVWLLQDMET